MQLMQRFLKRQDGGILFLGAGGLFVLVMFGMMAINGSRYMQTNGKFQQAIDSALLAAATSSQTQDVNFAAREYFEANFDAKSRSLIDNLNINVTVDGANMAWNIEASARLKVMFGEFFGLDAIELSHEATVQWDTSARVEAVFTVDTSSSMCMDAVRSTKADGAYVIEYRPDPSCRKLNAMKESLSYVVENGLVSIPGMQSPAFYAGIVPFNHKVKMPNLGDIPPALTGVETTHARGDTAYFTNFDDAEPLTEVVPLVGISSEASKSTLRQAVQSITQSPTGLGWTRSNIAALTAGLMLDPAQHRYFGGERPDAFNPGTVDKVVVLMTDGANIGCCYAVHPEGNFSNQYLYLYQVDNAHLVGLNNAPEMSKWSAEYGIPAKGVCDTMKDAGITIYSVVYDVNDNDPGGKEIKDAYRQCASNEQFFFDVLSDDELKLAYKTIAQSFLKLRISY